MRKYLVIFFVLCQIALLEAQSKSLFEQIRDHNEGIGLWWAGHNGWIIKSDGLVISTDILLDYRLRTKPSSITNKEFSELIDISFITHGHRDHFSRSTSAYLAEHSDCMFVIPESCVTIAEELKLPKERIKVASPREPFQIMGVQVEPLRAIHGNANFAIYYEANLKDCGYVINLDGIRFLQPGDSYLLEDHLFLKDIDVLFFSPTEHNMYIDRSIILINTLDPDYIFPQHHSTAEITESTRFWAKAYQDEVKLRLSNSLKERYHIPIQGDMFLIKK